MFKLESPGPKAHVILLILCATGTGGYAAETISEPFRRRAIIESIREYVYPKKAPDSKATFPHPFPARNNQTSKETKEAKEEPIPVTAPVDAEAPAAPGELLVLEQIIERLDAAGTIVIGDKVFLLSRQGRMSAGSRLDVEFNGKKYILMVAEVTPASFTITMGALKVTKNLGSGSR